MISGVTVRSPVRQAAFVAENLSAKRSEQATAEFEKISRLAGIMPAAAFNTSMQLLRSLFA